MYAWTLRRTKFGRKKVLLSAGLGMMRGSWIEAPGPGRLPCFWPSKEGAPWVTELVPSAQYGTHSPAFGASCESFRMPLPVLGSYGGALFVSGSSVSMVAMSHVPSEFIEPQSMSPSHTAR